MSADDWWELLRIEIGDVVRVVHATPDGRTVDVNAMIRGIEWSANTRSFELELSLQTLNPDYVLFVLDDPDRAVLSGVDGSTTYVGPPLSLIEVRS
jgi:hypothetical protein